MVRFLLGGLNPSEDWGVSLGRGTLKERAHEPSSLRNRRDTVGTMPALSV
jgi:hypothetical protein